MSKREYDAIIVGAGPAGCAAAVRLANRNPDVAGRTLLLERAVFPRPKLCAGGVTRHADDLLLKLGVQVSTPSFPVHAIRFVFEDLTFTLPWRNAFRVVRREEFDAALALAARSRGVELCEGEAACDFHPDETGVTVLTEGSEFRARVVIGADGANSVVRRKLGLVRWDRISRLLEVLAPADSAASFEFTEHTAVLDFTPILSGVQGYVWRFPSIKQGVPTMNVGVYDGRIYPKRGLAELKPILANGVRSTGADPGKLRVMGHPERWFDAGVRHSAPRVVLAGDAAGVEPLLGEGISHALDFGILAADAVLDALARNDFSFAAYGRLVSRSALGRRLTLKRTVARFCYANHPRWRYRLGWKLCKAILQRFSGPFTATGFSFRRNAGGF
jgi:menaquinone-9 beta-reductase